MKCYQAKAGELTRQWYVVDATDAVVGRLAAQIAPILMGKHRPTYTPHIDTGDYVIVTNVDKVVFTGKKWQQKSYQRYSGYPGGQKEEAAWKLFQRRPERILELAIQRMMPKNKIGRHMMLKLKLYAGPQHPHQAQSPIPLNPFESRPPAAGALWAPEPTADETRPRRRTRRAKSESESVAETTEAQAAVAPDFQAPAAPEVPPPAPEAPAEAKAPPAPEAPTTPSETGAAPEVHAQAPATEPEASLPAPPHEEALPAPGSESAPETTPPPAAGPETPEAGA